MASAQDPDTAANAPSATSAPRGLSRRSVLGAGAAGTLALGLFPTASRATPKARPNVLIVVADDWGYPHAGAYADPAALTPVFDRVAGEGALFTHAFAAAPSCTPSRNAILTGQAPHRLEAGANLWSSLPARFASYPDLLEKTGYRVGKTQKAYGPGSLDERPRDPAGPDFADFGQFLQEQPADVPFAFWLGSADPHRPYDPALGEASDIDSAAVDVPPYLPDTPEVREDIVNYLAEVQRFDRRLDDALALIEDRGLADNTIVVVTSDNGWPWPRAKATVYDAGTRVPLAIRWPGHVAPGTVVDRLTVLSDLAPTFLEAAGIEIPADFTGQSLIPTLTESAPPRDFVVLERERHARSREPNLAYPARAVRTADWLYIRNYFPERWPAGDPDLSASQGVFSDIDAGPTKTQLIDRRQQPGFVTPFRLATGKRGAEELYDLRTDPHSLADLADDPKYAAVKAHLAGKLLAWQRHTGDLRAANPRDRFWDNVPYYGPSDVT
ncbi:sulfatase family protein [Prauserella cavernicola]|uniref:Sulfatase n=1 Tax=Prauserella cavernicola TaxID=2800127 RepID=A0A934QZ00_9PSEU|nr:sulfatase [Prauserella cavernicola]MBK1787889.1 sulfatase [Prauserella cavernicola]